MVTTWRSAFVPATVTVLVWAAPAAVCQPHRQEPEPPPRPQRYEADCRTVIEGSRATAYCHNPYPSIDRVRLHVECERWWDIDADSAPVVVGPMRLRGTRRPLLEGDRRRLGQPSAPAGVRGHMNG